MSVGDPLGDQRLTPGDVVRARVAAHRDWVAPLVGRTCSRLTIDRYSPPVVLAFLNDGPSARLEIDASFGLRIGGATWDVDVSDPSSLAPILGLVGRSITAATNLEDGSLRVEFAGDAVLAVPAGDETWWYHEDDESP